MSGASPKPQHQDQTHISPLNSTALPMTRVMLTPYKTDQHLLRKLYCIKIPPYKSAKKSCFRPVPALQRESGVRASSQHPTAQQQSQTSSSKIHFVLCCHSGCKWDLPPQDAGTGWCVRKRAVGSRSLCHEQMRQTNVPRKQDSSTRNLSPCWVSPRIHSHLSRVPSQCSAGKEPALKHFFSQVPHPHPL